MIHETIAKLETTVRDTPALKEESRTELLQLLDRLRHEVGDLAKTDADQARSIAGFAAVSTHEATRSKPDPAAMLATD